MPKIFLSYRRADSAETVTRLYDRLAISFGRENVFRDEETLQRGDIFPDVLRHWVTKCDVFLAVIGERWLTIQDESGRRRLDNPNDWVFQETKMALDRNKACMLVPVLVNEASLPAKAYLPDDLKALTDRDLQTLHVDMFHDDVTALVDSIRRRFGLVNETQGIDLKRLHVSLVEVMKAKSWGTAREIVSAMRQQGTVPTHFGLDAIEQALYREVKKEQRDDDYKAIKRNAELVEFGLFTSDELMFTLQSFWEIYPDIPNYDPDNLACLQPPPSQQPSEQAGIRGNLVVKKISASDKPIPTQISVDLKQFNSAVLKFLPPPFDWCFVPSGNVTLKTNALKTYPIADFAIAKYPVTNNQFQVFVESRDGYMYEKDHRWYNFSEGAREYRLQNPKPKTTGFIGDDLPRTNVTWYDAVAFCRWLSHRTSLIITLPIEQHWQRAAIGDTDWKYPWGNKFDNEYCNTSDTGIGKPVSVTDYPNGISPYGVFNMSGNVWEWCLNDYGDPEGKLYGSYEGSTKKVLRGGSFNTNSKIASPTSRNHALPNIDYEAYGFRLALSFPIS